MPITASAGESKERIIVPAGNYLARCYSMVYLGTHISEFQGKEIRRQLVRITWELPTEKRSFDGVDKPLSVSREFTLSLHEKSTLRSILESWRGRGFTPEELVAFDITKLVGVPCFLNVIHKTSGTGNEYAFVSGVSPLPKGFECPDQFNPSVSISQDDWKTKIGELPEWLQTKIMESREWKATELRVEPLTKEADPSLVPF